jgi:hypothetical protein
MQCERVKLIAEFFPDFALWLAKHKSPRFLEEAEDALSQCSDSAIAKACKRLLASGDQPRNQALPFVIASRAKLIDGIAQSRAWYRIADGQPTVACPICEDSGYVTILHPNTVAETLRTGKLPAFPYEAAVACSCAKGRLILERDRQAEPRFRRNLMSYDQKRHIRRESGVLPMDQYRALLRGVPSEWARDPGRGGRDVELIIEELAESTRIKD